MPNNKREDQHDEGGFLDYTVRERLVKLEAEVRQLRIEVREAKIDIKEVRDVVVQVRGARWVLIGLAAVASAIGALLSKLVPFPFK